MCTWLQALPGVKNNESLKHVRYRRASLVLQISKTSKIVKKHPAAPRNPSLRRGVDLSFSHVQRESNLQSEIASPVFQRGRNDIL